MQLPEHAHALYAGPTLGLGLVTVTLMSSLLVHSMSVDTLNASISVSL